MQDTAVETPGAPADGGPSGAPAPLAPTPAPGPVGAPTAPPDGLAYRAKRRFLGDPLHSDELEHQRLGKPTALAVFASDNLSSSAYATEEILHVLIPLVGIAAFSLVVPVTVAMLVVLGFLILSYRETIKEYPSAGGAYLVTRDNFGIVAAQVAGASLLTDYILTVAVSASAGTAALVSAFGALERFRVPIAIGFIALIAFGNLRGVKESGRVFAVPTYFFMLNMLVLLGLGLWKYLAGDLTVMGTEVEGHIAWGSPSDALFYGAGIFGVLHAFASGGAAVTGVEAISNGVPAFREPAWRNARQTLVLMGTGLGVMFLGLSMLAGAIRIAPFEQGTPTVIAQVGEAVYGGGVVGDVLFYALQAGTMLILVMAANTGFADFPRLASFQAGDSFLPRQMTKRGHRLVYSNGIITLALAAMALVVATQAVVTRLIPLYAIGVFTGFTLSQAGMTRHHIRRREPGWQRGLVINSLGAGLSFVVTVIIAVTKFADGAWMILIVLPVMVWLLLRLNGQYEREAEELERDVPAAVVAPVLRRHVVLVFVDRLDMAAARAIQYGRTHQGAELRAVHFAVDDQVAAELAAEWQRLGLSRVPLEVVECSDRRLTRAAVGTVAAELADGETEVSVLLPDRKFRGIWHRVLHDRTADSIERAVSQLPHANVTAVPFHLGSRHQLDTAVDRRAIRAAVGVPAWQAGDDEAHVRPPAGTLVPIAEARWRDNVTVRGRVRSMRVAPQHDSPTLELVLQDGPGSLSVVFLGRRSLAGIGIGTRLEASGTVGLHKARLAILNPRYRILR
ncbi:MAG TPA: amino acid permease [Acidimicrobiales bacterium]|nr:amino acid permease [Acidimicrobiales bacterium]